jgi:2-polyprenyl-3-methyl-5-hydroxy-6-metoxy-1,4-benzoquinol methylase
MKCEVCNAQDWRVGKKIVFCKRCTLARAKKKNFFFDSKRIYSQNYYHGGAYLNYEEEKQALEKNFSNRLRKIIKIIPRGKLLEVGSAYGYFLKMAKKFFEVEGVEYNPTIAKEAERIVGAKVYPGDFQALKLKSNYYDVIVGLDTIEHLKSPSKFLKKCYRLLKPGGFLFLETGDIGSLLARWQGEKWRLICPPEHLYYFSSRTLKMLLGKKGFRVIKIERVWFWRTAAQVVFKLFPQRFKELPKSLKNILGKIIVPINSGDLIFITAQKS